MSDQFETTPVPGGDSGCLRRIMAVPLTILYAIAAFCCYTALITRPSGSWDQDAYGAIALMCWLTIAVSVLGLLVTVAPPTVRRAMGPWWLGPPLILSAIAMARWVLGT
ncbi:hypothetical protein ABT115_16215 [Streptomyces sp. NPDC001832]|uniref:hypothetical protein n=1 Tax=Streptomyces sp. NPDC001832 TaxID=3154527 RepID=UPI00331DB56D